MAVRHGLSEKQFAEIVQTLERFIFRYVTICKVHPGKLADKYYAHCVRICEEKESYVVDDLITDLRKLLEEDAPDSFFKSSLVERLQYSRSTSPMILYFLSTLEDYRDWYNAGAKSTPRRNATGVYDISTLEVEHIYPQTPKIVNQDLEPLKHDLGNLSFLSPQDNKSVRNADFSTKKVHYSNSNVSLNRDLGNLDSWSARIVNERREKLIEMAVKVFTV